MAEENSSGAALVAKGESQKNKKATTVLKKPKAKATHPPTSEMVISAIKALKERGGSSLPAIKKYLAGNYKVDVDKLAPFIKKYLKSAVSSGVLIQTKGKGAAGSFKLSKSISKPKVKNAENKIKKSAALKKAPKKPGKEKVTTGVKKQAKAKKENKSSTKIMAKNVKKSGEVKSKVSKQKPTKPTKTTVKSTNAAKSKAAKTVTKKSSPKKISKK